MRYTKFISVTGVNAGIYSILYFFNIGFPIIGISGAKPISIAEAYAILSGYLFGWRAGGLSVAIGGFIVSYIQLSPPFYILNFIPATTSAIYMGLIREKRVEPIYLYLILITAYLLYPKVGVIWLYPLNIWFHILIYPVFLTIYLMEKRGRISKYVYILISTLSAHLIGSILFMIIYQSSLTIDTFRGIWAVTTILYPIERVVIAGVAYILVIVISGRIKRYINMELTK